MLRDGRRTLAPLCLGRDGEEVLNEEGQTPGATLCFYKGFVSDYLLLAIEIIPYFVLSFTKHVYIHYLI